MELKFTARSKEQENTDYTKFESHGLSTSSLITGGSGSIDDPQNAVIKIINGNEKKWSGIIHLELNFDKSNPLFFLPGFMYGRNRGECPQNVPNEFPRMRDDMKRPSSPWWMVRGDRLSHPVALVYDGGRISGFCASPYFIMKDGKKTQWMPDNEGTFYQYGGYTCSLTEGTLGYTLGYENAPWLFIQSHDVRERPPLSNNCFELDHGESVEINLCLYEFKSEKILDINAVVENVYYRFHQKPRLSSDVKTTVADISLAVSNDAWLQDDLGYSGQVFEDNPDGGYRYNKIFSISWTNGLAVATPMLMAALRLNNDRMRDQTLSCISNIVDNSLNHSNGLPYDSYGDGRWFVNGWWFDGVHTPGHSSYVVCQALFYLMKAYEYEKRLKGLVHDKWMDFVKSVLNKIEGTKNTDDEYPYIFSQKTGAGLEYDSFGSVWCMTALAYYVYLTGDKTYIESLKKSEKHYYEEYVSRLECYGTPLDTDKATDSEGILAYIKALRYLHAITGEKQYLDHMKDAICYEFTFKFCYNSPVKIPPLNRGWSSCGGSITSIANPHIHPMSSNLVDELLYFTENRNDKYILDRLNDTVGWGCQTYNTYDREFDFGKKGWMSERFCYSEGLVSEKYPDGTPASTWFCLMPWASAMIIEGLAGDYWDRKTDFN